MWLAEGRRVEGGPSAPKAVSVSAAFDADRVRNSQQVMDALSKGTEQVVDARAAARFRGETPEPRAGLRSGHMPGAINLDIRGGKFAETLEGLDKSKTYLVHCAVGGRSAKACGQMDGMKFEKVLNLSGGITAWEAAGHKAVKGR